MDSGIARNVWKRAGVSVPFNDVYKGKKAITKKEAHKLANASLKIATEDAQKFFPKFDRLTPNRQDALINLSYQMGYPALSGFKKFKQALENKDYRLAAQELVLSEWYKQTQKSRTRRILEQIIKG
jgi:lysozyme